MMLWCLYGQKLVQNVQLNYVMHKVILKQTKCGNTDQLLDKFSMGYFKFLNQSNICPSMIELLLASVVLMGK